MGLIEPLTPTLLELVEDVMRDMQIFFEMKHCMFCTMKESCYYVVSHLRVCSLINGSVRGYKGTDPAYDLKLV